jgi:molybdopterin synthase sulfur carrier subunit
MGTGRVEIRLYASLQKWKPSPAAGYELGGAKTVGELLALHAIPEDEVAIIMINGKRGRLDTPLADGDSVSLFPLIGGG